MASLCCRAQALDTWANLFIYLFLAALHLHCCAWAFSSCGERGLLFVAVCGLLIVVASLCCRAQALGTWASVVVARRLIYLFIYFWLHWVFVAAHGLSLVAASGGYSLLQCAGFSLCGFCLLRSTGSRHAVSVVVARGLSCSLACGIFLHQGSNLCPLHWQVDS